MMQIPLLRGTEVGRRLCRFKVSPVRPWCDRSILRAPLQGTGELSRICRNPFQPPVLNRRWLSGTVQALAQAMHESGDLTAMPILADALQKVGCDNVEVLGHCRSPGVHLRGCWVLDLVLAEG
jgi:hypothetical protein